MNRSDEQGRVQLNDFRRQWQDVGESFLAAVRQVGESGWYILGNEVQAFERTLAGFMGRKHVVGCANGMDSLEIAFRALGMKPGDRVLTTPLSAFATTLAIVRAGGVPVFVDTDSWGLMDLQRARVALELDSSIRFLVPVHLYGHAVNLGELEVLEQEFSVQVVEDCCQAIGARWGRLPVGAVGAASALSFYPTKNLGAFGDGGAILTDNSGLNDVCRSLRDYGQTSRYRHDLVGLNSRLDELHASALLTALLPRLESWTARRRTIAGTYLGGIAHRNVKVPGAPEGSHSVWHLFPVLVPKEHREHFRAHLESLYIASAIHYPLIIPRQNALASVAFACVGSLDNATEYSECEVSLPIHPYMTDVEVARVVAAVNSWQCP